MDLMCSVRKKIENAFQVLGQGKWRNVEEIQQGVARDETKSYFDHIYFQGLIRHPSGDAEKEVEQMSLKLKRETGTGDINVRVIGLQMFFKGMGMNEVSQEESLGKEVKN